MAEKLVELTKEVCTQAKVVRALMSRHLGPYLASQEAVDEYNMKVKTANAFLKTVLEDEPKAYVTLLRSLRCNYFSQEIAAM